jgi:flagellar biosynthesis/type III secretory pathway protein FliH
MALSDLHEAPPVWSGNSLLNSPVQVPHFLRTSWDEASAPSFGPWRLADNFEPTEVSTTEWPGMDTLLYVTDQETDNTVDLAPDDEEGHKQADEADGVTSEAIAPTAQAPSPWTEAALEALRDEAYQHGLREGQAKEREERAAERSKERDLLAHLGLELRSLSQDPQRFFEPLKRLSLHLAEQLVRAELQISGQAVHNLVQACIQQLDHAVEPVQVSLNPEDLLRLKQLGKSVTDHMQLEADPLLRPGSVRVRVQDSLVQDLIENRLEPLARRLLAQPDAWMQQSSLVKDRAEALPAETPSRDWSRQVLDLEDIEDSDIKPTTRSSPASRPAAGDTHVEL